MKTYRIFQDKDRTIEITVADMAIVGGCLIFYQILEDGNKVITHALAQGQWKEVHRINCKIHFPKVEQDRE